MVTPTDAEQTMHAGETRRRARVTLDLDPDLHLRLKIAAAQERTSMREYAEHVLQASVPTVAQLTRAADTARHPATQEGLERLLQTRERIMHGRRFAEDSADLLHEAREERQSRL